MYFLMTVPKYQADVLGIKAWDPIGDIALWGGIKISGPSIFFIFGHVGPCFCLIHSKWYSTRKYAKGWKNSHQISTLDAEYIYFMDTFNSVNKLVLYPKSESYFIGPFKNQCF